MSVFIPTGPEEGDSLGITLLKWLQALRANYAQTDSDTVPDLNDQIGQTLKKILTVYLRA